MPQKPIRGFYGNTVWFCSDRSTDTLHFGDHDKRRADMIDIFNRYSGSHFAVSKLAKRYGMCDRMIQYDLKTLEKRGLIRIEKCVLDINSNVQPATTKGRTIASKIHYIGPDKVMNPKELILGSWGHLNKKI